MSYVTTFLISILSGYLAFTNTLAVKISEFLPSDHSPAITTERITDTPTEALRELSTEYAAIPKILLENSSYQQAAVAGAVAQNTLATDPFDALVNIFCTYTYDNMTHVVTGTGYLIASDGIVLTNAHVAQFLLLEGILGRTKCVIRTGNPAVATYDVALLYISPAWIIKNANLITTESPKGTGERDYALLYVTGGLNNQPIPRTFKTLPLNTTPLAHQVQHAPVSVFGYPAETLFKTDSAKAALVPRRATTTIEELFTFGSKQADVFTIAGTAVGEQGASGGPIVNQDGQAIGLISTRGDDASFGSGSLRAITLSYIARTYAEETGTSFTQGLSGDLPLRAKLFREMIVPVLQTLLKEELEKPTP